MNKLFKTEMTNMLVKRQLSSDEEEAEGLRISLTARKQSLLPQGSMYIILYIFHINMFLNTKKNVFPEFDDEDDEDDDIIEDEVEDVLFRDL